MFVGGGKERDNNYWECCAPQGPALPETCYTRGINLIDRDNEQRYENTTKEGCFEKCKGRWKGLIYLSVFWENVFLYENHHKENIFYFKTLK